MSTYAELNDGTVFELPSATVPEDASHDEVLDMVLEHLDHLGDVTVTEADAAGCGALGCRRRDTRSWRIDVDGGRRRTLCPSHAIDFTRKESDHNV